MENINDYLVPVSTNKIKGQVSKQKQTASNATSILINKSCEAVEMKLKIMLSPLL